MNLRHVEARALGLALDACARLVRAEPKDRRTALAAVRLLVEDRAGIGHGWNPPPLLLETTPVRC